MSRLLAVPRVVLRPKYLHQKGFAPALTSFSWQPERSLHAFRRAAPPERCHTCQRTLRIPEPQRTRLLSSAPSTSKIFSDPDRSDLFYHLIQPPNPVSSSNPVYAVSFISTELSLLDSKAVMGWVPAGIEGEVSLIGFQENASFKEILHEAIRKGLQEGVDDIQINGALQTHSGWMHVHDDRNIPALGRIGDPDDIIASVLVEDGKILAETYQPMPAYRLYTADGITRLTPGLDKKLREVLMEATRQH
ncbi:hypothetical protein PC9H_000373 [Pleurotus ostreatus]|uniref:Uncharacterized protein n=1 Tax=Pleurotus ostreatus TaxID=5322 RepID=A0A8H7DWK0_PLEOS|nr:uncharacterized protein PC9H_000373 [Pleurotus ostreatus]KAF7440032.1 hypothetical protein PC9H_000373 [Pleurotus ostreatus]KAJ8700735.1 hypothetical protein PTI98_003733 [Pleurotus ostreatus]